MKVSASTLSITGGGLFLLLAATLAVRKNAARQGAGAGETAVTKAVLASDVELEPRRKGKASHRWDGRHHDDPEVQRQAEEWYRELLAHHPEFQVEFKDVPDALLAIALGEEPPVEPITGEPFLWDPASRTLSPPAVAPADIDPLQLPAAT